MGTGEKGRTGLHRMRPAADADRALHVHQLTPLPKTANEQAPDIAAKNPPVCSDRLLPYQGRVRRLHLIHGHHRRCRWELPSSTTRSTCHFVISLDAHATPNANTVAEREFRAQAPAGLHFDAKRLFIVCKKRFQLRIALEALGHVGHGRAG